MTPFYPDAVQHYALAAIMHVPSLWPIAKRLGGSLLFADGLAASVAHHLLHPSPDDAALLRFVGGRAAEELIDALHEKRDRFSGPHGMEWGTDLLHRLARERDDALLPPVCHWAADALTDGWFGRDYVRAELLKAFDAAEGVGEAA